MVLILDHIGLFLLIRLLPPFLPLALVSFSRSPKRQEARFGLADRLAGKMALFFLFLSPSQSNFSVFYFCGLLRCLFTSPPAAGIIFHGPFRGHFLIPLFFESRSFALIVLRSF